MYWNFIFRGEYIIVLAVNINHKPVYTYLLTSRIIGKLRTDWKGWNSKTGHSVVRGKGTLCYNIPVAPWKLIQKSIICIQSVNIWIYTIYSFSCASYKFNTHNKLKLPIYREFQSGKVVPTYCLYRFFFFWQHLTQKKKS